MAQLKLASQNDLSQGQSWRIRPRLCLEDRCERSFRPSHHLDRYCSPECLESARRWQLRFANQIYRRSDNGRLRRMEQAQRYRLNLKERKAREAGQDPEKSAPTVQSDALREGYTKETSQEKSCCHRPGCYRRFTPPPQSPLKKFCSPRCSKAVRRVILRERKWVARLKAMAGSARDGPQSKAS